MPSHLSSDNEVSKTDASTLTADVEMRFEDLQLFVYKDIEKCLPTLCGAFIFAVNVEDACNQLNAELKKISLLTPSETIDVKDIVLESASILWSRGKVIPLSVYMINTMKK